MVMDNDLSGNIIIETPIEGEPFDKDFTVTYDVSPLPYLYNPEDDRMNAILDQVVDFCGYELTEVPPKPDEEPGVPVPQDDGPEEEDDNVGLYPELTDELDKLLEEYQTALAKSIEEKSKLWPKIWQAIRYISDITCWTDSDNDTFITQIRHQIASFNSENGCCLNCANCEDGTIAIKLAYLPHPEDFLLGGQISAVINGKVKRELITYDYLAAHYDEIEGVVYIDRYDFPKLLLNFGKGCCKCKLKVNIRLDYLAGYDQIPDGILQLICPFISKLEEAKIGMSNCHQAMTQVSGLLKRKKSGNVEYEWSTTDSASQRTQTLYTDLYNIATLDEVMAISRCYALDDDLEIGDVV